MKLHSNDETFYTTCDDNPAKTPVGAASFLAHLRSLPESLTFDIHEPNLQSTVYSGIATAEEEMWGVSQDSQIQTILTPEEK